MCNPGTLPVISPLKPPMAGITPKLVNAPKFSLPSYRRSTPLDCPNEAPTPKSVVLYAGCNNN